MVWLIGEADFIMDKFKLGSKTTSLHCPLLPRKIRQCRRELQTDGGVGLLGVSQSVLSHKTDFFRFYNFHYDKS